MDLASELDDLLATDGLRALYQPVVNLDSGAGRRLRGAGPRARGLAAGHARRAVRHRRPGWTAHRAGLGLPRRRHARGAQVRAAPAHRPVREHRAGHGRRSGPRALRARHHLGAGRARRRRRAHRAGPDPPARRAAAGRRASARRRLPHRAGRRRRRSSLARAAARPAPRRRQARPAPRAGRRPPGHGPRRQRRGRRTPRRPAPSYSPRGSRPRTTSCARGRSARRLARAGTSAARARCPRTPAATASVGSIVAGPLRRERSARSPSSPTAARRACGTKDLLLSTTRALEEEAAGLGEASSCVSAFQEAERFTPATLRRYERLAASTAFTAALGAEMPVEPARGVRGAALDPGDPLRGEWDIAVLGPHYAAALVAAGPRGRRAGHGAALSLRADVRPRPRGGGRRLAHVARRRGRRAAHVVASAA